MSDTTVALIVAAGGWLVAIILSVTGYLERRGSEKQELLLRALDFLTGKPQRRSVGIAIVEGLWKSHPEYQVTLLPALTNQAVYLLLQSEQGDARHEFHNWLRIMKLIMKSKPISEFHDQYCELADALSRRAGGESGGISMPKTTARSWLEKLHHFAGLGEVI